MSQRIAFETIGAKMILNRVKAASMPFEWSINPYRGCQHGCSFCYARSTHSFFPGDSGDTFQRHIYLKANAAESLRKQLQTLTRGGKRPIGRIAIGTATDPYQQAEGSHRLTRACLEVLADYGVPVTITTRSPLILRDLDVLADVNVTSVNVSISTLDPQIWRAFEPSSPSPRMRMDTVGKLRNAGIPATVFLAPILPYLTDGDAAIEAIVREAADRGASSVMASILRLSTQEVKTWFFASLRAAYPGLSEAYGRLYYGTGSTPPSYSKPVLARVAAVLERYGLAEHLRRSEPPAVKPEEEGPVQLAFSF